MILMLMTLRSILEDLLSWLKENQAKVGKVRDEYQRRYDEEQLVRRLSKMRGSAAEDKFDKMISQLKTYLENLLLSEFTWAGIAFGIFIVLEDTQADFAIRFIDYAFFLACSMTWLAIHINAFNIKGEKQ